MTHSGVRRTYPMIASRLLRTSQWEFPGAGMLGWTAIYEHANIVEKQLANILYVDRVSNLSSSQMKMDSRWFRGKISGGRKSVGRARTFQRPAKKEKYNRMTMIMVWIIRAPESRWKIDICILKAACQWLGKHFVKRKLAVPHEVLSFGVKATALMMDCSALISLCYLSMVDNLRVTLEVQISSYDTVYTYSVFIIIH